MNTSALSVCGAVVEHFFGDAHVGAVLARQAEDVVNVGAGQAAGHFVGDFAARAVNHGGQAAALSPGRIGRHMHHLTVRLRLADHAFQQVVNVDDVALLAQADRDVFEVNIEGDRLAGDAQDHFERLEDDPAQAGRRLVAPDAYARPPGRRDALRQGGDVHARRGDDQLVNDLLFE